jgi:hypothetical protein
MKNLVKILTLITLIYSCQEPIESEGVLDQGQAKPIDTMQPEALVEANVTEPPQIEYPEFSIPITDFMLMSYIAFSENALMRADRRSNIQDEWVFDRTLKTDTADYLIYQIGHDAIEASGENQHFVTTQWIYLDTAKKLLFEYDSVNECLNKWPDEGNKQMFYPVYELSPKTTAMVVPLSEIGERRGVLDSIFNDIAKADGVYEAKGLPKTHKLYDSTGIYKLVKSSKLETAFKTYFDRELYVYGTNGYVKTKVKDIAYGLDECISNIFAFCFDKRIIASIGHPVFCSDKMIDLIYAKDYSKIEKSIQDYVSRRPGDYSDSIKAKVLGNVGDFYFTYNDDFLWNRKGDKSKCKFPARQVYWVDAKSSVDCFWTDGLDLFGIPCD